MTHKTGCESIRFLLSRIFSARLWSFMISRRGIRRERIIALENVIAMGSDERHSLALAKTKTTFLFCSASRVDKGMNFNDSQVEHMVIIKLHITKSVPSGENAREYFIIEAAL